MFPPRVRLACRVVAELLVIAFFVLIGWVGWSVLDVLATDNLVSLPEISVRYTQSVIPLSAALIVLAEILTLPAVLADALRAGPEHATGSGTQ